MDHLTPSIRAAWLWWQVAFMHILKALAFALRVRASALAPHSWVDYLLCVRDLSTCKTTQCALPPPCSLPRARTASHPPSAHTSPARLCRTLCVAERLLNRAPSAAWPAGILTRLDEAGDADAADADATDAADEGTTGTTLPLLPPAPPQSPPSPMPPLDSARL